MRRFVLPTILLLGAFCAGGVAAQTFTFDASNESGLPGSSVDVSVTMDSSDPIRGYSLGLSHDADLILTGIVQGAASAATNSGMGADFIHTDLNAIGGPGGILGVVISLSAPIEDIPVGSSLELGVFSYTISGGATPGSSLPVSFTDALGQPTVSTVVSVAGTTFVPTQNDGSVLVEVPAVNNLTCSLIDPCVCDFDIAWTNPVVYDSITVTLGGATVATLGGVATSTTVSLPQGNMDQVCVIGTVGGVDSALECCMIDCPVVPAGQPPQNLVCTVDPMTCVATVTWTNPETYLGIEVTFDGAFEANLGGTATSTTVTLPDMDVTHEICLVATDGCGVVLAPVCCMVVCTTTDPQFVRGECNGDNMYNIADAIAYLGFLFPSGTPTALLCLNACDCNDDENLDIGDAICILSGLFGDVTVPPLPPHPGCGIDPTPGALGCDSYAGCP